VGAALGGDRGFKFGSSSKSYSTYNVKHARASEVMSKIITHYECDCSMEVFKLFYATGPQVVS